MENFREMEKEFKMKQYSKRALQHRNRGEEDSEEHSEEISDES
jgi:CCR4-NOT transcriptional regulation complex NOT5 subunit